MKEAPGVISDGLKPIRILFLEDSDLDAELDEIVGLEKEERSAGRENRGWRGLRKPWVRPALVVGCWIAVFTQLSGIEMIIYYAPTILTDNGFSTTAALRVSVALGVTYLVMMIVGGALFPLLMGKVADMYGIRAAFFVPIISYVYIAWYGWWSQRRLNAKWATA